MLLKYLLLITNITTSIGKSVSYAETEISKLAKNETNTVLENESSTNKEFCIFTESIMVRMVNPYYVDSSNNTIYLLI